MIPDQTWFVSSHEDGWEGYVVDAVNDENGHVGLLVEIRTQTRTYRRCVDVPNVQLAGGKIVCSAIEFDKGVLTASERDYVRALVCSFLTHSSGKLVAYDSKGPKKDNGRLVARVEHAYITGKRNREAGATFSAN